MEDNLLPSLSILVNVPQTTIDHGYYYPCQFI